MKVKVVLHGSRELWSLIGRWRETNIYIITKHATAIKDEDSSDSPWASEMQLVRFRAMSEQVAESYLKKRNIKLRMAKRRRVVIGRHWDSYRQGWADSSKIDIPRPSTVT
ncbi:hypothetical protein BO83DRAFT_374408 [Aspergillus terreus]|uniref:Uncharacterized protein n=1 Tax=Aspergillus terreus TaxID=33178 RepID=A0A5M3ZBC2_ASPTE|nr:hypothetical protein ATETN484_0013024700 [Aspergillus terreus]GFF20481.1 hypothetical protein BO83DRAFT_374408 [Aspergillus terreus]